MSGEGDYMEHDSLLGGGKGGSRWRIAIAVFITLIIGTLFGLLGWQIHMTRQLQSELRKQNPDVIVQSPYASLQPQISATMDATADPCNDFYQYSCGGFLANTPPQQYMYTPVFTDITINNLNVLFDIVTNQWPLISDLYASCMAAPDAPNDDEFLLAISVVIQTLIDPLNSTAPEELLPTLAALHSMGSDAFFTPSQMQNLFTDDSIMYLALEQSGVPPFSVNYTGATELKQVSAVLQLVGITDAARALNVVNLEIQLFNIFGMDAETYQEYYVSVPVSTFRASIGNYSYDPYFTTVLEGKNLADSDSLIVTVPSYFAAENLTAVLQNLNISTLKDYLTYRTFLNVYMGITINAQGLMVTGQNKEGFEFKLDTVSSFHEKKFNVVKNKPRSIVDMKAIFEAAKASSNANFNQAQLSCINIVNAYLPDFVGLIFTLEVLDPDVISDIHMLTGNIQNAFKNSLSTLEWIDSFSQNAAAYKLKNIIQIIGHPNFLQRYRGLQLDPALGMTTNILLIQQAVFMDQMRIVGQEFNRSNYEFPSTIVNAFYSPPTNTINFPAGILQPPMYSYNYPPMLRYARLGYVIGHETTHGFDNNGRLWSAFGVYSEQGIFDNSSSDAFETQTQCLINQFDSFEVTPGVYVNGEQTLGENIADLGGVKNAYRGYKAWIAAQGQASDALDQPSFVSGLNNNQLFWVMLGQTWCTVATDAQLIAQVRSDEHSPSKFRINGPLANFDEFASAFQCKAGAPMNPTNKCVVW